MSLVAPEPRKSVHVDIATTHAALSTVIYMSKEIGVRGQGLQLITGYDNVDTAI
jgi:hypothetical protein